MNLKRNDVKKYMLFSNFVRVQLNYFYNFFIILISKSCTKKRGFAKISKNLARYKSKNNFIRLSK